MLLKGGMGNGEYWSAVIPKKLSWSLHSTAKRRGLHVESERWKVKIFIYQFSRVVGIIEFLFIKINQFDLQVMRVTITLRFTSESLSSGWCKKIRITLSTVAWSVTIKTTSKCSVYFDVLATNQ